MENKGFETEGSSTFSVAGSKYPAEETHDHNVHDDACRDEKQKIYWVTSLSPADDRNDSREFVNDEEGDVEPDSNQEMGGFPGDDDMPETSGKVDSMQLSSEGDGSQQWNGSAIESKGHDNMAFSVLGDDKAKSTPYKAMKEETCFLTHSQGQANGTACDGHYEKGELGVHDVEPQSSKCGLGACHPRPLQRCTNMVCFTAAYSLTGMMTSALSVYISSQITALERQFNFSSSVSGFLMSCNDLGYLLTTLALSYYTRKVHIPRGLALSTVVFGISGLLCTVAYFGTRHQLPSPPSGDGPEDPPSQMCALEHPFWNGSDPNNATTTFSCEDGPEWSNGVSENWRKGAIFIIAIGMIVQGVAKSPRHSFVGTYVDDNIPKTRTTMYLGVMSGLSIFGPAVAFTIGGFFSQNYVTLEETSMSRRDPRWIGAWWLGFIVFGSISLVAGIPLIFFPKYMYPKAVNAAAERQRKKQLEKQKPITAGMKGFFRAVARLATNPVYACLNLGSGLNLMSVSGMLAFLPKYLEVHFMIPAWKANILIGSITVLSACLGTIIGGFITSRFKIGPIACIRTCIGVVCLSVLAHTVGIFLQCDQPDFESGLANTTSLDSQSQFTVHESRMSSCASTCDCNTVDFFPTCGADGRNYFSPCHAGCFDYTGLQGFANCSCLTNDATTATAGLCEGDCGDKLMIYVALSFMVGFCLSFIIMPHFTVNIRSVSDADKPLALGISAFLATLIGWFPGPIVFGAVIDQSCLVWKESSCEQRGACLLYDYALIRNYYHGLMIGLRGMYIVILILIYLYVTCTNRFTFQPHIDLHEVHATPEDGALKGEEKTGFCLTVNNKKEAK